MDAKERTAVERVDRRDVVLYIAMSLDGYIADRDGGVSWLETCGEATLDEEDAVAQMQEEAYAAFEQSVDTVVLGWSTYHQIVTELSPDQWAYEALQSYVVTHHDCDNLPGITFTDEDPCELVERLRREPGRDIWICGGAELVRQLMRKDLIDVYRVSVVPIVLGGGIRLFSELNEPLPLRSVRTEPCGDIVELVYRRR